MLPRRFALIRHIDYTGVSGIGVVAYGVTFADGQVVLRWCSAHPATSMWSSMDDLLAVHGHGEATSVEWIDAPYGDLEELAAAPAAGRRGRRRAARGAAGQPEAPRERGVDVSDDPPSQGPEPNQATAAPPVSAQPNPPAGAGSTLGESRHRDQDTDRPADHVNGQATHRSIDQATDDAAELDTDLPAGEEHTPDDAAVDGPEAAGADGRAPETTPDEPAPAARARPILRSVRGESEHSLPPLLSSEVERRSGQLHVDTAPLLLTFREHEEEPLVQHPRRRGGRHRRADPDAG